MRRKHLLTGICRYFLLEEDLGRDGGREGGRERERAEQTLTSPPKPPGNLSLSSPPLLIWLQRKHTWDDVGGGASLLYTMCVRRFGWKHLLNDCNGDVNSPEGWRVEVGGGLQRCWYACSVERGGFQRACVCVSESERKSGTLLHNRSHSRTKKRSLSRLG